MRNYFVVLLIAIICLGGLLRIFGMNWDGKCCMHPDERAIIMFALPLSFPSTFEEFLSPESPLNPHFFAYGNLPLYILKSTATALSFFNPQLVTYDYMNLVGRGISIIADLFTILFIFLIARKIWNRKVALVSSFFYAVAVFPLQASHFFTVDTLLTTFITLTLYFLVRYYEKPSVKTALLIGITFGLSLTTKVSALPLLFSILTALFLEIIFLLIRNKNRVQTLQNHIPIFVKKTLFHIVIIFLTTFITFAITQPYALIDFSEFINQNQQQSQMTKDAFVFPYTLQYVGIPRYIYQLHNVFLWGLGPLISIFSIAGIILLIKFLFRRISQKERAEEIILISFFLVYFGIVGSFAVGWMRYMLPIYPLFCIFAGVGVYILFTVLKKRFEQTAFITLIIVSAASLIWPLSFITIYTSPNTRVQATEWIHTNISAGSSIAIEHWDDALPMYDAHKYRMLTLPLYDPDTPQKWADIEHILLQTDYIILASNRLYVPLQKLTDCATLPPHRCYPQTAQYYKKLFNGSLGFKKIIEIAEYPTVPFFNIPINDQGADEAFTVYDHPKIIIFQNTNPTPMESQIKDDSSTVYY